MNISRLITGIILVVAGLGLMIIPFLLKKNVGFSILIYGVPILIIGIFILLNKKEDVIEPIKNRGGKKK